MKKNFFNISDLSESELRFILQSKPSSNALQNKNIGLIFENYSTRTRISFTVAINQMLGNAVDIKFEELNISRSESFEDTFKAFNCYLDGLVYRTDNHRKLIEASYYFKKPIINALSEISHPCQILGDILTLKERFGKSKINILWMGDMNNVCFSLVEIANIFEEISLTICTPYEIEKNNQWNFNENVIILNRIEDIKLEKINCVMTDVFISMNDQSNEKKNRLLEGYQVSSKVMNSICSEGVFMHCLPAQVGKEVTEEVFKSPKSIVWEQASNRLVAQKKLLEFIFNND